jgi:CheY-like chemotaxis protein
MDTYSKSILVIHDDAELVRQIADGLGRHGCRVEQVSSAREAYDRLQRETLRPRMVVADWSIPYREHFPLIEQMAAHPRMSSIPLIVLADPNQTRHVVSHGVRAALSLPVRPRALAEIIATLCGFTAAAELDSTSANARSAPSMPWDKNGGRGNGHGSPI